MVTEAIMDLLAGFVETLLGALPEFEVPDWLATASGMATEIAGYGAGLGVWVPARLIVAVAGTLLVVWLIGFGIKLTRIVASFLTFGGGSAA